MPETTRIRSAAAADADAVANVYLTSRKELVAFAPLAHTDESVRHWIAEILLPAGDVTVVEESGVIVGMMALSREEGIGWIEQLYLLPSVVGRGIGTTLVTLAKSSLASPIRLYTFQENSGTRRFYERHGFQAIAFGDGSGNEENCPDVLYEWRV